MALSRVAGPPAASIETTPIPRHGLDESFQIFLFHVCKSIRA
jgi:hypothetical protein